MLLNAIPKSGSTSLKYSIAENGFIEPYQKERKEFYNVNCDEYKQLQLTCTTIFDFDSKNIWEWLSNRNFIYKKHILPTNRHLKIIEELKIPFVVLLRNVSEIVDSFERLKKQHFKIYNWDYSIIRLRNELEEFEDKWIAFSNINNYILKIYYKDLIENYQNTMDLIFNHFNLRKRINYLPLQNRGRTNENIIDVIG